MLNIGCSIGEVAIAIAELGNQVVGMDLNEEMIKKAKKVSLAELQIEFKVGDMRKLEELFRKPFDGIVCLGNAYNSGF